VLEIKIKAHKLLPAELKQAAGRGNPLDKGHRRKFTARSSRQLLLGQSFLARFKSWSLDNTKRVLLLNPQ
jgi:hypothetical protein